MIISASRRTDIPAYHSDWFFDKIAQGYTITRNPFNPKAERVVDLTPAAVDGFVFWSKNPAPMLDRLNLLENFTYYFLYTLNAYEPDAEPGIPPLCERISAFRRLSEAIGSHRVVWRYDPIFVNRKYAAEWHIQSFYDIADKLSRYTTKVIISFLDIYRNIKKRINQNGIENIDDAKMIYIASALAKVASEAGIKIEACAEPIDLTPYGVARGCCVNAGLLADIAKKGGAPAARLASIKKDRNQRPACGCSASVDIGAYGTCPGGCIYCYATR